MKILDKPLTRRDGLGSLASALGGYALWRATQKGIAEWRGYQNRPPASCDAIQITPANEEMLKKLIAASYRLDNAKHRSSTCTHIMYKGREYFVSAGHCVFDHNDTPARFTGLEAKDENEYIYRVTDKGGNYRYASLVCAVNDYRSWDVAVLVPYPEKHPDFFSTPLNITDVAELFAGKDDPEILYGVAGYAGYPSDVSQPFPALVDYVYQRGGGSALNTRFMTIYI